MQNEEKKKYAAIGRRIELARRKEGLTQGQLAEKLSYQSPTAVSLIEAGKRYIKVAEMEKIAAELHSDLHYLLTGESKAPTASVRMALRSQHKELTGSDLDKIESFIEFMKAKAEASGRKPSA